MRDEAQLRAFTRRIEYASRSDVFTLWFLGDLHVGAANCDEEAIRADVRAIQNDPTALWFGLGDMCEFINRQDWRFRQSQLARWVRGLDADYCDDIVAAEVERAVALLSPVADKCAGFVAGNHEDKILARFERDVQREICRRLGVADLGDVAWVRLLFKRSCGHGTTALDVVLAHGVFASRKDGAKVNNLQDLLLAWNADIVAVGHGHTRLIAPPVATLRVAKNGDVVRWRRYALMAGSYLETYKSGRGYAERKLYRPNDAGPVRLFFQPDRERLWAEV